MTPTNSERPRAVPSDVSSGAQRETSQTQSEAGIARPHLDIIEHVCSGCHYHWTGDLKGAELCGDCWRKGQAVILGAAGPPPALAAPPQTPLRTPELDALIATLRKEADEIEADGDFCCAHTRRYDADELEKVLLAAPPQTAILAQVEQLKRRRVHVKYEDDDRTRPIEYVAMAPDPEGPWVAIADVLALCAARRNDMMRKSDYDLFFSLLMGLHYEHKARTGHDLPNRRFNVCDVCMYLKTICEELEARQYDDVADPLLPTVRER